jgi:hypothetical protein
MSVMHERATLKSHALLEACIRGHTVPGVVWDDNRRTGGGMCMRCGAAFALWLGVDGSRHIYGPACARECPRRRLLAPQFSR